MDLERAQRSLHTVMCSKPIGFPTDDLHKIRKQLSLRKLYVLNLILHVYKTMTLQEKVLNMKRKGCVAVPYLVYTNQVCLRTIHLPIDLYQNRINRTLNIYNKLLRTCTTVAFSQQPLHNTITYSHANTRTLT